VSEITAVPALARYVAGWGRPGDVGFVADDDASIGAAWWRRFDRDDPGYGFVDEATPELSIGVVEERRGQGVGTRLLAALVTEAERSALPALSLSVEPDNPAARLYERFGFRTVGVNGGSLTMLKLWS
jgi:ribosomal protein S18 acetylase RimI-like enzyme